MKKKLFVAASAAFVLSSCSNEVENVTSVSTLNNKAITVSTYTPGLTRATPVTTIDAEGEVFWMYAINQEEAYINKEYSYQLDGVSGEFVWAPTDNSVIYWPEDEIVFHGLYNVPGLTAETYPSIIDGNMVAINNVSGESDVMVASTDPLTLAENDQNVALGFKHILADIAISITGANEEYNYTVSAASLSAPTTGTFSLEEHQFTTISPENVTFDLQTVDDDALEVSATSETAVGESVMVVPAESVTLIISYVIKKGEVVINNVEERDVEVRGIVAGALNTVHVTLNPGKLPITVSTSVDKWGENNINSSISND